MSFLNLFGLVKYSEPEEIDSQLIVKKHLDAQDKHRNIDNVTDVGKW